MLLMRSLTDYMNERYLSRREFAALLGVSEQTLRRLLNSDPKIENTTKRQAAARLGVPPHVITEFTPAPSPALLAALTMAIDEANRDGWFALDLETGIVGDERIAVRLPDDDPLEVAA